MEIGENPMALTIGDLIAAINALRAYDEERGRYFAALEALNIASNAMRNAIRPLQNPWAKHIVLPKDFDELAAKLMCEE